MRESRKLVSGLGVKGTKYPMSVGKIQIREYKLWVGLLQRCSEKYKATRPAYNDVICSENFKSYTFFYEWCHKQVGFNNKDSNGSYFQIDKDILVKGNKLYSEDTCCFVPRRINTLLITKKSCRGKYPIGVYFSTQDCKFRAACSTGVNRQVSLGYFDTQEDAFQAYKTYKEALIKQVAEEYKGQICKMVFERLLNYKVDVND